MRPSCIGGLATAQCGVVSRQQLLAGGSSRQAVGRRVAAGSLLPIHAGVYALGHRALPRGWREWAAVLACGIDAVLSHRDHRLIVELDGRAAHATVAGFEADRRRDDQLQLAGFLVLRFTHRRLHAEPAGVVREVAAALGARTGAREA